MKSKKPNTIFATRPKDGREIFRKVKACAVAASKNDTILLDKETDQLEKMLAVYRLNCHTMLDQLIWELDDVREAVYKPLISIYKFGLFKQVKNEILSDLLISALGDFIKKQDYVASVKRYIKDIGLVEPKYITHTLKVSFTDKLISLGVGSKKGSDSRLITLSFKDFGDILNKSDVYTRTVLTNIVFVAKENNIVLVGENNSVWVKNNSVWVEQKNNKSLNEAIERAQKHLPSDRLKGLNEVLNDKKFDDNKCSQFPSSVTLLRILHKLGVTFTVLAEDERPRDEESLKRAIMPNAFEPSGKCAKMDEEMTDNKFDEQPSVMEQEETELNLSSAVLAEDEKPRDEESLKKLIMSGNLQACHDLADLLNEGMTEDDNTLKTKLRTELAVLLNYITSKDIQKDIDYFFNPLIFFNPITNPIIGVIGDKFIERHPHNMNCSFDQFLGNIIVEELREIKCENKYGSEKILVQNVLEETLVRMLPTEILNSMVRYLMSGVSDANIDDGSYNPDAAYYLSKLYSDYKATFVISIGAVTGLLQHNYVPPMCKAAIIQKLKSSKDSAKEKEKIAMLFAKAQTFYEKHVEPIKDMSMERIGIAKDMSIEVFDALVVDYTAENMELVGDM
jgi:hypothetical protein